MKTTKAILLLSILFGMNAWGQNQQLAFSSEILTSTLRSDQKELAVATKKFIYLIDAETLNINDSIDVSIFPNHNIYQLDYLGTHSEFILARYIEYTIYDLPREQFYFLQYPNDSIVIFNIENKKNNKLPGNVVFASNYMSSIPIIAINDYYEYSDEWKNIHYSGRKGILYDYKNQSEHEANGIVRSLVVSPDSAYIAISYYDSSKYTDNKVFMRIELRSLPDLRVISTTSFNGDIESFTFSPDSKNLIVQQRMNIHSYKNSTLKVFNLPELTPYSDQLKRIEALGKMINGNGLRFVEGDVIQYEVSSNTLSNRIWANLTPMFDIQSFYFINNDQVLLTGNGNKYLDRINAVYKFSFSNNAIYTNIKHGPSIDTLYHPSNEHVSDNAIIVGVKQISDDGKIMLVSNKNQIQLWDTKSRLKLIDVSFANETKAYLHANGKEILLFSSIKSKKFDDFSISVLNIATGRYKTKNYKDNSYKFLNPLNYTFKRVNSAQNDQIWYLTDGSYNIVWELHTTEIELKEILNVADFQEHEKITDLEKIPMSNKLLISCLSEKDKPNHYTFDLTTKKFESILFKEVWEQILPLSLGIYLGINSDKKVFLFNEKTQDKKAITTISSTKKVEFVKYSNGYYVVFKIDSDEAENKVWNVPFNPEKTIDTFTIINGTDFFSVNDAFCYTNNKTKEITSFYSRFGKTVNWSVQTDKKLHTFSDFKIEGNLLYVNHSILIDLSSLEIVRQLPKYGKFEILNAEEETYLRYHKNEKEIIFEVFKSTDLKNAIWQFNGIPCKLDALDLDIKFSKDKKFALAIFNKAFWSTQELPNYYVFLDFEKKKAFRCSISKDNMQKYINRFDFAENDNEYIQYLDSNVVVYSLGTREPIKKVDNDIYFANTKRLSINSQNVVLKESNTTGKVQLTNFYAREYLECIKLSPKKNFILAGGALGNLIIWEIPLQSPIKVVPLGSSAIKQIIHTDSLVFTLSEDYTINVIRMGTWEILLRLNLLEQESIFSLSSFTPDGFFKASKSDLSKFHFVKDLTPYSFSNLEIALNRPDKLFQKLGYTDPSTIKIYHEAYQKRIARAGYKPDVDIFSLQRPSAEIVKVSPIGEFVHDKNYKIQFNLSADATRYTIFDNGVPITNKSIVNTSMLEESINLHRGENKLTLIAYSKDGIASDPIDIKVNLLGENVASKVYYIGIGVSQYKDTSWNLHFADKDVRSIVKELEGRFVDRLILDTLTNEKVTKASVLSLKQKLLQTNVDDIVIISFSGHGILDSNLNFYFATTDIDFRNPAVNGLSFQELNSLLSDIPSRRKLMLIDACNSGEIEDGVDLVVSNNVTSYGTKGSQSIQLDDDEKIDSYELMRSLFYNPFDGNGSYIISAAGGKEYAYESDLWQNGVFTFCFINALIDLGPSWDKSKQINILDLQNHIYLNVSKLTNGKQRPTSRIENASWNWKLN